MASRPTSTRHLVLLPWSAFLLNCPEMKWKGGNFWYTTSLSSDTFFSPFFVMYLFVSHPFPAPRTPPKSKKRLRGLRNIDTNDTEGRRVTLLACHHESLYVGTVVWFTSLNSSLSCGFPPASVSMGSLFEKILNLFTEITSDKGRPASKKGIVCSKSYVEVIVKTATQNLRAWSSIKIKTWATRKHYIFKSRALFSETRRSLGRAARRDPKESVT